MGGDVAAEGPASDGRLCSPAGFFPFARMRALKGGAVGSMYNSCNLTCHITRKTRDNYVVLKKVQFALLRKIGEFNLFYL